MFVYFIYFYGPRRKRTWPRSSHSNSRLVNNSFILWETNICSAGLTLEINIEQAEYISELSQEAGIRVFIGGQGDMPFPYEQGKSVSPGFSTAIELRKVSQIYYINFSEIQGFLPPQKNLFLPFLWRVKISIS